MITRTQTPAEQTGGKVEEQLAICKKALAYGGRFNAPQQSAALDERFEETSRAALGNKK